MLLCHTCCALSRLRRNGHSLLLSSYLSRIGKIENLSCIACGHLFQDTSHLILHCTAAGSLRRSLFGDPLSLYALWSRHLEVFRLLGLHGLPPCPHLFEGMELGNSNNELGLNPLPFTSLRTDCKCSSVSLVLKKNLLI